MPFTLNMRMLLRNPNYAQEYALGTENKRETLIIPYTDVVDQCKECFRCL